MAKEIDVKKVAEFMEAGGAPRPLVAAVISALNRFLTAELVESFTGDRQRFIDQAVADADAETMRAAMAEFGLASPRPANDGGIATDPNNPTEDEIEEARSYFGI